MADRYWVGGSGTWDATSTANWSATSGGASGASAPTSVDRVFFYPTSASGSYTVNKVGNVTIDEFTVYPPTTGTLNVTGTATITVRGINNVFSQAGFITWSTTLIIKFAPLSGPQVIYGTSGSSYFPAPVEFSGSAINFQISAAISFYSILHTSGTLMLFTNLGTQTTFNSSNTNVRGISFSGSVLTSANSSPSTVAFDFADTTNLTITAGSGSLSLTTGQINIGSNSMLWPAIRAASPGGTIAVNASNTLALKDLQVASGAAPTTFNFASGVTYVFSSFTAAGSATGPQYTSVICPSGTATFVKTSSWKIGLASIDLGGNSGINFIADPSGIVNYLRVQNINGVIASSVSESASGTSPTTAIAAFSATTNNVAAQTGTSTRVVPFFPSVVNTATVYDINYASNNIKSSVAESASGYTVSYAAFAYLASTLESVVIGDVISANFLWIQINDGQTPYWTVVADGSTMSWQNINDAQTPSWQNVEASQGATWSDVDDPSNPGWTPINQ